MAHLGKCGKHAVLNVHLVTEELGIYCQVLPSSDLTIAGSDIKEPNDMLPGFYG